MWAAIDPARFANVKEIVDVTTVKSSPFRVQQILSALAEAGVDVTALPLWSNGPSPYAQSSKAASIRLVPEIDTVPRNVSKYDIGAPIDNLTAAQYNEYKDKLAQMGIPATEKERVYPVFFTAGVGGGRSRAAHRRAANAELYRAMEIDPRFRQEMDAQFGYDVMAYMASGRWQLRNPAKNMEWHHPIDDPAHVELLRKKDHRNPEWQEELHFGENHSGGYGANYQDDERKNV